MEVPKEFGDVQLSLENCIISEERLRNTPSHKDGVSQILEVDLRIVGCEYIQSAGLLLKLPQVAMATAQILFQRFYYSKSFVKYSFYPLAIASLFLAAKIEENCRRLRDVINVFHHLKQKRTGRPIVPMEYMGEQYFSTKNTVIKYERYILKELGFCVHVQHPHKLIISYLKFLELSSHTQLTQRAWNYMNDSLRTNVFVRYSIQAIACACVYLAAGQLQISLPSKPPWWLLFDVKYKDIKTISLELLALYQHKHQSFEELDRQIAALRDKLKKQVEIKEVAVKKDLASGSQSSSPRVDSPLLSIPISGQLRSSSRSPLTKAAKGSSPTNSQPTPPITASAFSRNSSPPVNNGRKRAYSSLSPSTSPDKKLVKNDSRKSSLVEKSANRLPSAYKPICSPIKISSEEGSAHSDSYSGSPGSYTPPGKHNGVLHSRRVVVEERGHHRHHHHKHRSSDKHRHRERSRSRSRERHHHHHHHHRDKSSKKDRYSKYEHSHSSSAPYDRQRDSEYHYSRMRKSDSFR